MMKQKLWIKEEQGCFLPLVSSQLHVSYNHIIFFACRSSVCVVNVALFSLCGFLRNEQSKALSISIKMEVGLMHIPALEWKS